MIRPSSRFLTGSENEPAVRAKTGASNMEASLRAFVSSKEYRAKQATSTIADLQTLTGMDRHIYYDVSADPLRACFDRVRREWTFLGEKHPYWSVTMHDRHKVANLDGEAWTSSLLPGAPPLFNSRTVCRGLAENFPRAFVWNLAVARVV